MQQISFSDISFLVLIILIYSLNILINREEEKSSKGRLKLENKFSDLQRMALQALYKESKYTSQGGLEEFSDLNQLSTSVVKVWFNNRRQREDSVTLTVAVTTNDDVVV